MDTSEEVKLVELKQMLIARWILKKKSSDDWLEYKRKYDQKWIASEGLPMLLTQEMMDLMVDKQEREVGQIFYEFIGPFSVSSGKLQFSIVRLCTVVSDGAGKEGDEWKGHRVMCWVVGRLLMGCGDGWSNETIDCVFNYLVKVIDECNEMEMVKWALLTGEMWWVKMKMESERRDRLRTALTRYSQTHNDTLQEEMDRLELWDAEKYQVRWCARWCEDNLGEWVKNIPVVKLSRDRFEARCDSEPSVGIEFFDNIIVRSWTPVRSPFPVKSNVYFYEVICVTYEHIQVGWSSIKTTLNTSSRIGDEKYSVWLKINKKCHIFHNNERHPINTSTPLGRLNVIGCLLDLENRRFEFYLNGEVISCPTLQHFSPPYYATFYFSNHQQCHFNFGQCPFKFPPRNIRFTTFHEQSGGDVRKYRLGMTEKFWAGYWFAQTSVDNQVSLFFDDEIQNEFDREVRKVVGDNENDVKIGVWSVKNDDVFYDRFENWKGLRYIQAIIEVMGKVGRGNKVDVKTQWVGFVIGDMIDGVNENRHKLAELLYPYLQLVLTQSTLTQHRSICIILLHLSKWCSHCRYSIFEQIHSAVFTYLTRTLTSSPDQWTQLFVLIALADLKMSEHEKKQFEGCAKIPQMVEMWREMFEGKDVGQVIKKGHEKRLYYQLYVCSQKLLNTLTSNLTNVNRTNPATLNPLDLSPQLTLSPCHLSARSDWHWQSVRSVCQVSAHIYYFEVVLLTAGPMTLGWATKRTDLTKITKIHPRGATPIMVGFDEFCIGFDGFNRCIYHDNKTFQLENIPRWNAGDIVGCLIDTNKKRFHFYLNGIQINFNTTQCPIFFSSQPYHALISLSQLQQVYLNFGQSPFSSHRPKYIDFCDFHSDKPEVNGNPVGTVVNFHNTNLEKNLFAIDANINLRDVTITDNASTSNKSVDSTESIGNISSIHTIASVNVEAECRICSESCPTKLVRTVCCGSLTVCFNCSSTITECPKCKKRSKL